MSQTSCDTSNDFLLTDQVGSLRAVADTSGNIVKRIDYDSFGNIIADSNPAFSVPFGFAGGLHDRDTRLVRFGYRDYSPELGRFTAKDPIDFAGGDTNLYAYVMNDPVNLTDPLGLAPFTNHCDPVPFKPETTCGGYKEDKKYTCGTGQTCDVDAVYPPGGGNPVKIVNGCSAVCAGGDLIVKCGTYYDWWKQALGGGPVPDDWWDRNRHPDWPKPGDPTWPTP